VRTPFPELVRVVKQDGTLPDCAVAAVAMLCGVTYGEALAAFPKPKAVVRIGAYLTEIQVAAKSLGVTLRTCKRFDVDDDTGILHVSGKDEHLVLLWDGRIIDGNGECWLHPQTYLGTYKYQPKTLLRVVN
jgi:hypothetical protein